MSNAWPVSRSLRVYHAMHEEAQDCITGISNICIQGARRASAPKPGSEAAQKLEEEQAKQQPLRQYLDSRYNLPTELGSGPSTGASGRTSRMSAYSYSALHIWRGCAPQPTRLSCQDIGGKSEAGPCEHTSLASCHFASWAEPPSAASIILRLLSSMIPSKNWFLLAIQ